MVMEQRRPVKQCQSMLREIPEVPIASLVRLMLKSAPAMLLLSVLPRQTAPLMRSLKRDRQRKFFQTRLMNFPSVLPISTISGSSLINLPLPPHTLTSLPRASMSSMAVASWCITIQGTKNIGHWYFSTRCAKCVLHHYQDFHFSIF